MDLWKVTLRGKVKHLARDAFSSYALCGVKNLSVSRTKAALLPKCKICAELER